ncbi:ABC transporter substrate-binding protein [Embleya sp. NPDC059237]|uniref:ABC transporter substrate-binding protein n=1 Tax=Embleya sp. NPDC059237 TaxID=3346784 RepID=UPI0036BB699A
MTFGFRRGHKRLVALAAAVAGLATACTGGPPAGPTGSGGPPRAGGSLTLLTVADARGLDPFTATYNALVDEPRMAALYDPLFVIDPASGQVRPHLGESLTTTDAGTTWTLALRPNVRFSDGTPLDAEAVRTNWDMHADPAIRSLHRAAAAGLRLETTGPLTVRITPPSPNANLDRTIATELTYIAAPSALAKGPATYSAHPVGAGPFTLQTWTRGSRMDFTRNPAYWQHDRGLPHLDKLTIALATDIHQAYNTIRSGSAQILVSADPGTLEKAAEELNAAPLATNGGQNITFNLTRPPFDDPRARRAIAIATDPAELAKTLGQGFRPARAVFPRSSPFFDPTAAQPAADPAEAQRLFDELAAAGNPLHFTLVTARNPQSQLIAEFLQSRLTRYRNVDMSIEPLDIGAFVTTVRVNRTFQAAFDQTWQPDPEPGMYQSFHSTSPLNATGWSNPQADRALDQARATQDPAARRTAYIALQHALSADLPIWTFAESRIGPVWSNQATGVETYNGGVPYLDRIGLRS